MATFLEAIAPVINQLGALISTIAGALTSAGVYMAGPVTDLQVFAGTYNTAYGAALAAGANTTVAAGIADGIKDTAMAQTDTMTAFFSGIGAPFIAEIGQMMQDVAGILDEMPTVMSALTDFLLNIATFLQ